MKTGYLILLIPIVLPAIALIANPGERGAILVSIIKTSLFAGFVFGITLFIDVKSDGSNFDFGRIVPAFTLIAGPPLGVLAWWGRKRRARQLAAKSRLDISH